MDQDMTMHSEVNQRERNTIRYHLQVESIHLYQKTKIMSSSPITSWQIDGKTMETVRDFIFLVPKSLQMVPAAMKLKDACSLEEKL